MNVPNKSRSNPAPILRLVFFRTYANFPFSLITFKIFNNLVSLISLYILPILSILTISFKYNEDRF